MTTGHKRLLKLAEHLEHGKLGHDKFDFMFISADYDTGAGKSCGTMGCAIGELPYAFPEDFKMDEDRNPLLRRGRSEYESDDQCKWFGIDQQERLHLFFPDEQSPLLFGGTDLSVNATKEQVAANIRAFVAKKLEVPK